jgi:hypothetical protein
MPNQLPVFMADHVVECYRKGITDIREILNQIPGHIVADEGCIEKYKDMLPATTTENSE